MGAPDIRAAAYAENQIDDLIVAAAEEVDSFLRRTFFPFTATYPFPRPTDSTTLWLDNRELVSATAFTVDGVDTLSKLVYRPYSGPPWRSLELSNAVWGTANLITGVWMGCPLVERSAGTVSGALSSGSVTLPYMPGPRVIGVGHTVRVGTERMLVNGKLWTDSGQTGTLAAQPNAQTLAVANGALFVAGEELMIESERLQVVAVSGNNLTVRRGVSGSTLAAHSGAALYWPRTLQVSRGALGTTAAAASNGAAIVICQPPQLVAQLNRAYALDAFFQEGTGYARTVGSGDGERNLSGAGLAALEQRAFTAHARKIRTRAV